MVILLFWLIIALTSCSANWHLKRAIKKNPSLLDTTIVVKTDTVYISDIQKDTVVRYKTNVRDSIIFKDKTKVKYLITRDTIELNVDCPDQVVIQDSVFIDRPYVKEPSLKDVGKKYWYLPLIFLGILILIFIKR